jgi:hypothetical protein
MRSTVALLAGLLTMNVGVARGAEPTAEDLIVRGLELRRAAKPAEALAMFQRAHTLAPSPRTLGQMGLVETSLERWLDAEAHVTAALLTPGNLWVRKNRMFLDHALMLCRRHIGELVVTGPNGTDVAIDNIRLGTLPFVQRARLAEGRAIVTANNAGFKDFSKTVTIPGGAKVSVAIVLHPAEKRAAVAVGAPVLLPDPAPPSVSQVPIIAAEDPAARSWKTPAGVGLVAAGAGLMAWGITWMAVDRADNCPTGGPACNNVYDTGTKGRLLTGGGAAAAAVGTVLLYLGSRSADGDLALDVAVSSVTLRARF